jgi:superfamily II DNA/RNA helicase
MLELFNSLDISPSLAEALKKSNIITPTEIQKKVLPEAIKNKDLVIQSETGTGKTLAYLLPLYKKIDTSKREMQAMIIAPTHELVLQIQRQIEKLSENSDLKVTSTSIIGNVNIERQIEKLREKPHIIVGSPKRILELIKKKKISAHTIKTIIIDEADKLTDENNFKEIREIIKCTLKERQLLMVSASISKETEKRANEIMKDPEFIIDKGNSVVPSNIEHIYFLTEQRDKIEILRKIVRILNPTKAMVFVGGRGDADLCTEKLKYHGLKAETIHGHNSKIERKSVMEGFRAGKIQLLIASDIAARGLDIEDVTHIINLNLPESPDEYLHRVGRTGRNGKSGIAISIITENELQFLKKFGNALKINISAKDMYMDRIIEKRNEKKPKGLKR